MVNVMGRTLKEAYKGILQEGSGAAGAGSQGRVSMETLVRFHQAFSQEYGVTEINGANALGLDFLRSKLTKSELVEGVGFLENELEKSYVFVPAGENGRLTLSVEELCSVERIPSPFIPLLTDGQAVTGNDDLGAVVSGYHQLYEYQETLRANFQREQELRNHVGKTDGRISFLEAGIKAPFVLPNELRGKPASGDVFNHLRASYGRAKHEKTKEISSLEVDLRTSQKELASVANYLLPAIIEKKVSSILTGTAAKPLALEDISLFRQTVLDYEQGLYLPAECSPGGNGGRTRSGMYPTVKKGRGSRLSWITRYGVPAAVVLGGAIYLFGGREKGVSPSPTETSSRWNAHPGFSLVPYTPKADTIPISPESWGWEKKFGKETIRDLDAVKGPIDLMAKFDLEKVVAEGDSFDIPGFGNVTYHDFDWNLNEFIFLEPLGREKRIQLGGVENLTILPISLQFIPRPTPQDGRYFYIFMVNHEKKEVELRNLRNCPIEVKFSDDFCNVVEKYFKPPVRVKVQATGEDYPLRNLFFIPSNLLGGDPLTPINLIFHGKPSSYALANGAPSEWECRYGCKPMVLRSVGISIK